MSRARPAFRRKLQNEEASPTVRTPRARASAHRASTSSLRARLPSRLRWRLGLHRRAALEQLRARADRLDEEIGARADARRVLEIAVKDEPHVAIRERLGRADAHEPRLQIREVAREHRE